MQVITTHKNTDFDALSSLIAGTLLYPEAVPVIPKSINPNVKAFLSIHKDIFDVSHVDDINLKQVSRLVVVDTNKWERLDGFVPLKHKEDLEIFIWDHHPDRGNISANRVCHEEMGANITLMLRQIRQRNIAISPIQASLFLTGLHEDTGNLLFPSTQPEDVKAAAYLMEQGADLNVIGSLLRPAYGEKQKNALFEMLQSEDRQHINGYTVTFHKINIDGHVGNLSVVVHMCREILNADAVFGVFSGRKKGKVIVIGRSNADGLNIGTIMKSLGGGGHPGAGSAMLEFTNPDTVQEMISDLIGGNQQASVTVADLMSFPVVTVPPDVTMGEFRSLIREKNVTGMPVVEEGELLGIISRRDFRKIRKSSGYDAPVKAFMSRKVVTIEPGRSPMQAARLMVKHDVGRLPVVEDGEMIGVVSRSDAMVYFYDLMPE